MDDLINIRDYPVGAVLELLLKDKTTEQNIIFATDSYESYGIGFEKTSQMTKDKLQGVAAWELQPRVQKNIEAQKLRTKVKAEVMTPGWIVCKMNAYADEEWFGRPDVFESLHDTTWEPTKGPIEFPEGKTWQQYVDSRRIEITCGEAPYICSRYDVTTGELIPLEKRIGLLDRKLRVVGENTKTEDEWMKWSLRAFQSVYGYEFQGDNLLIARINLLNTYVDYMEAKLDRKPTRAELSTIANVIVWNFWQMDGITHTIPFAASETEEELTISWGDMDDIRPDSIEEPKCIRPICLVRDWRECTRGKAYKYTEINKPRRNVK